MTYAQFIAEIRRLANDGASLMHDEASVTHESRPFRDWRHKVESTVAQARTIGYRLPGSFESSNRRYYRFGNATPSQHRSAFDRDMADSITELRYLIDQFEKYGEPIGGLAVVQPTMATTPRADVPLAHPEKVTLRWLIDNVSALSWLAVAGSAFAIFLLGYGAGKIEFASKLIALFKGL